MNIVAADAQGGLSTLVPTSHPLDLAGNWQVLDTEGEPMFSGSLRECETFMQLEGLRPHCNCELIDITGAECGPDYGWDSF